MSVERPNPKSLSLRPLAALGERIGQHRRTLLLSAGFVLGAVMTLYGGLSLITSNDGSGPAGPDGPSSTRTTAALVTPSEGSGPLPPIEPTGDQRAVTIAYDLDQGLSVGVGDHVELIALRSGPLDTESRPLGLALVASIDEQSLTVVVDRDQAIAIVAAQADGSIRLLGLAP